MSERFMSDVHPDAGAEGYVTKDRLEEADRMLTMMAHVASHVADQEHAEPEDEPSGDPVVYDPNASEVRHV